jgi:hypothetical protein
MTWVDIAKCCAATPKNIKGGVASSPSGRCINAQDLQHMASVYGDDRRAPCKQDNLGWYKDTAHALGEELWKPRYTGGWLEW